MLDRLIYENINVTSLNRILCRAKHPPEIRYEISKFSAYRATYTRSSTAHTCQQFKFRGTLKSEGWDVYFVVELAIFFMKYRSENHAGRIHLIVHS